MRRDKGCTKCSSCMRERYFLTASLPTSCDLRLRFDCDAAVYTISAYSDYGPLDLFSGSKDRIHKAIKDLFSSPQNNFRVFLDGSSNASSITKYDVCFIDLDLKPLAKIEEYYEKDKKIVSCYTRMVEAKQEADKVTSLQVNGNAL